MAMATTAIEVTKRTTRTVTQVERSDGMCSGEVVSEVRIQAKLDGGELYELEVEDDRVLRDGTRILAITHRNRWLDTRPETFRVPEPALRGLLLMLGWKLSEHEASLDQRDGNDADGDGPLYDDEG